MPGHQPLIHQPLPLPGQVLGEDRVVDEHTDFDVPGLGVVGEVRRSDQGDPPVDDHAFGV